ncbi:MAG: zinc ribbon domain-containing protein [Rhizonema sp. PD38]|nr:zinc ribbon domain-containing protein [Rhizonema sp. PD38]
MEPPRQGHCDALVPKQLAIRVHDCKSCGLIVDRDINAAINVQRVGLEVFPTIKSRRGKLIIQSTSKEILELTRSLHHIAKQLV